MCSNTVSVLRADQRVCVCVCVCVCVFPAGSSMIDAVIILSDHLAVSCICEDLDRVFP